MVSYERVNKPTARKMYNHGCSIFLLPCKANFKVALEEGSPVPVVSISLLDSDSDINRFDRAVNTYEYYNCNAELGYYAHYYVTQEDLQSYNMCKLMCN